MYQERRSGEEERGRERDGREEGEGEYRTRVSKRSIEEERGRGGEGDRCGGER